MSRWTHISLVAIGLVAAGCGGSPVAPTPPGVSISALLVQIDNESNGGYGYTISYTVHNSGPSPAAVTGIDATLTANGSRIDSFSVSYLNGGFAVPVSESLSPSTTTFVSDPGIPRADKITVVVHIDQGGTSQSISSSTPLG